MNSFWWELKANDRKSIRRVSWGRLCVPKKYGGMDFRNLHYFNLVILGKKGANPSFIWKSIHASIKLLANGVQ
ncbi:hypothetical protein CXB51_036991 [Gossypium anomalum]|uniref:Reverse transcriptase zinc-binding domain-containing protein n=1 Tax=Gossypium anomalum TaxID=47600 RepID=A0A8J6CEI9_9ROSI|nr:hypothetical protein CXB51_036991 [Gossypium anomalum]